MSIQKDLRELESEGIISSEVARKIVDYYQAKEGSRRGSMVLVFGILGSILVGLGIILILGHNWDLFSKSTKLILAVIPLVLGQAGLAYALWARPSRTWLEGASGFLVLAVGACTAMVSQIYHIGGDMEQFMLVWILLTLPILYLSGSGSAFILLMCGITFHGSLTGYGSEPTWYVYWVLLLAVVPFYYRKLIQQPAANATLFYHWAVALSVTVLVGAWPTDEHEVLFLSYTSLFGCFYLIGSRYLTTRYNAYQISGSGGLVVLLLILSFGDSWTDLNAQLINNGNAISLIGYTLLTLTGIALLVNRLSKTDPVAFVFLVVLILSLLAGWLPIAPLLINLLILGLGVWAIRSGVKKQHLGELNGGLLLIAALITCRFFDQDFSFVVRGVSFVVIGIGFFIANYLMIKRRTEHD